jgi:hypothetical protein
MSELDSRHGHYAHELVCEEELLDRHR